MHANDDSQDKKDGPRIIVNDRRHWARDDEDDDASDSPRKPTYVAELEEKLASQEKLVTDIRAQAKAAKSEFEEARARLNREVDQQVKRGVRKVLVSLLEVMDNLDRAVEAADSAGSDEESLRGGMKLVREQFLRSLEEVGVHRVSTVGEPFDPALHEAVSNVPVDEPTRDNRIVGEIKGLYRQGDDVLRPGVVAVGQYHG